MKTDEEVIAEVRELDAKATEGPWESNVWTNFDEGGYAAVGPHHKPDDTDESREENIEPESPTGNRAKKDANFIAAARTLLPDLAARLQKLNERVKELEKAKGWRPISEAPKDGTRILVGWFADEDGEQWMETCAFFVPSDSPIGSGQLLSFPGKYQIGPQVTYFTPLPEPPTP